MSFYRIYRPLVIADIDNAAVRGNLESLLKKDRKDLPHAYLCTGPKGTGKTTAARIIAKMFNCLKPGKNGPCGTCSMCISIASGRCMDVIEMDAASNRGIDEIRQLRERIGFTPTEGSFTVYIIDEVHMLTTEAFNALLKTLEEPPQHVIFILATTNREKVPDTIQSRCMTITFTRADDAELLHALSRIVKAEKLNATDQALRKIAQAADGSFRDAVKYLEQMSFSGDSITEESVARVLSLSDEVMRREFLLALNTKDAKKALLMIADIHKDGRDMKEFVTSLLSDLHSMLVGVATGQATYSGWNTDSLRACITRLSVAYTELKVSPLPQLPVELAAVEFCGEKKQDSRECTDSIQSPEPQKNTQKQEKNQGVPVALGLLTMEKLVGHWQDFIAACKPYNHSVAGVLRSSRPKSVEDGIVTLEAFYSFHRDKLTEPKTRQILSDVLKKLFGEKVKVEIVLGKK